jgi:hypothetical protein
MQHNNSRKFLIRKLLQWFFLDVMKWLRIAKRQLMIHTRKFELRIAGPAKLGQVQFYDLWPAN